jgi:glycosyltransferase involved in cell wall biosynthesis
VNASRRVLLVHAFGPEGYPPVVHVARVLAANGFEVDVLGATMPALAGMPWPQHPGVERHEVGSWANDRAGTFLRLVSRALRLARHHRPRWVWCSDPWSLPAAWPAAHACGAGLVYQEHDSPPASARGERWPRRMVRPLRRAALRRAAHVVFPNLERLRFARSEAGPGRGRDHVLWNTPMLDDLPARRPRSPEEGLRLHFHGSINPFALPLTLIDALAALPEVSLRIVGYCVGHQDHLERFLEHARRMGVQGRVDVLAARPRAEVLALAAEADVGIAFYRPHPNNVNHTHMFGGSNKIFDYLAAGLALLLAESPEWHGPLVPAHAWCCEPESSASIIAALRAFIAKAPDPAELGSSGRARIRSEWHFERQFAPLLAELQAGAIPRSAAI